MIRDAARGIPWFAAEPEGGNRLERECRRCGFRHGRRKCLTPTVLPPGVSGDDWEGRARVQTRRELARHRSQRKGMEAALASRAAAKRQRERNAVKGRREWVARYGS